MEFISKVKTFFIFKKRKAFILGLVLIVGLFIWLKFFSKKENPQYQTVKVKRGTIVSTISASGQITASNLVPVYTQASGIVRQVYVQNNAQVKKGDKIAQIELDQQGTQRNAQAYASYLSAKSTLEQAKANKYSLQAEMFQKWDKFKELAESDEYKDENSPNRNLPEFHIPQKEWLAAEAKYKNQDIVIAQAQATLRSAWLLYNLTLPIITAPVSGKIISLSVAPGVVINNDSSSNSLIQIAVIQTQGSPLASFNLSEIDIGKISIGQKATIVLDALEGKTFTGKVVSIDRAGKTVNGVTQYPVIVQFDTQTDDVLPNMTATAHFIIEKKDDVLLIPTSAVQEKNGQSFVQILENGQIKEKIIQTGISSESEIEVIEGLKEGDEVIIGRFSTRSQQRQTSPFSPAGFSQFRRFAR